MDNFEGIIRTLLEADHFWVQSFFKVELTLEEKRHIGKHSMPRPELDLLALHFEQNEVLVVEAKSFLDSSGLRVEDLERQHDTAEARYKLFTSVSMVALFDVPMS